MIFTTSTVEMECNLSAPARARRHLCDTLGREHTIAAFPDAVLILSELVTNAVLHANCAQLRIDIDVHDDGRLRLAVIDTDTSQPVVRQPTPDEVGGLGLLIVDSLASDWGVEVTQSAKAVWAEIQAVGQA